MPVGNANATPAAPFADARLGIIPRLWAHPRLERASRALALGACALLFLDSAGTINVVYTLRPSFLLFGLALALGAPAVYRGWLSLAPWLRWAATGLLLVHVLAALLGDQAVLAGNGRAGSYRDLLYIADIIMGLGVIGLLVELFGTSDGAGTRPLLIALCTGGVLAAAYGLYQWFAQHYGLPLSNVNNTLDSNGVTSGGDQGAGLLGWERIRGTFLEPHFLAAYLAGTAPLVAVIAWTSRRWLRWSAIVATAGMLAALALTASAPGVAAIGASFVIAVALASVARGHVRLATLAGGALVVVAISVPVVFAAPSVLAPLTGRSGDELEVTTRFRQTAWTSSIDLWSRRPILGYGPGQSSVQLARRLAGDESPVPLSAQGVWAASLVDTGAAGIAWWIMLIGGAVVFAVRAILREPTTLRIGVFFAATTMLLSAQVAGDRLGPAVWVLLSLMLAVSLSPARAKDPCELVLDTSPPLSGPRGRAS